MPWANFWRGDMERLIPDFALYGSRDKWARTDTVFFPIFDVCIVGKDDPYNLQIY